MILDVHHHTVETDNDRPTPLRVTIYHREELTLLYGLATTDMDQDAQSFQELLHYSLVASYHTLSLYKSTR
jgi:hypothetical protein